jgi:trimethylamine--corrinoid protein Co-methyltransferase
VGPAAITSARPTPWSAFETAFDCAIISDWRNFESWREPADLTADQKANATWQKELAAYERPDMDPAIEEELDAFVARRKAEGGAPTDF